MSTQNGEHTATMGREAGTPPSQEVVRSPLPLPKFTFLFGGRTQPRFALASEIANLDREMLLQDLEEPLRLATHSLFYGGYQPDLNLTDPAERIKAIPSVSKEFQYTIDDWLYALEELLRAKVTSGALGKIALWNYVNDNSEFFFTRVLFRDAETETDIQPFIDTFGKSSICCIHLGAISSFVTKCNHIWLPIPEVEKQIDYLRRELSNA